MPPFLVNLLIGIALNLAATVVQLIFAQDQKEQQSGIKGTIQKGGDNPLAFIMGFFATPGQFEYAGTWGTIDETPNSFYTIVISLSDLPVSANTGVFVNDERVTLGPTPHSLYGYPVIEYKKKGKDYLWIKFYDGTQTVADDYLLEKFTSGTDRPWDSSMIGKGTSYAIATARVNRELFSGLPEFNFELQGIKLYDVRKDTTAGGSGSHRLNDPATWEYSDNPIVGVYNLLLGLYYDGDWFYGPQNTTQSQLPYANWAAQMDKCDAPIDLSEGGTEKRFRFGYEVLVSDEPQAVIGELLKACEGRIAVIGGFYKVLVGEPDSPVRSITDEEILISESQTYEPFPGLEDTFNGVTATYPEPDEGWNMKEAPSRYDAALELEDNGNRLPFDTQYKAVPFARQVQRNMEMSLLETRRFRKHSFTGKADWWEYEPLDTFAWDSTRNGYTDKQFLITVIDDAPNANQIIGSQEIDPTDYDWSPTDEIEYETVPITINRPNAQPIVGWSVAPYTLLDEDGDARRPGILLSYAAELDDVRAVRVQVRVAGQTSLVFDGEVPYDTTITDPLITNPIIGDFLAPNVNYEVRGIFVPYSSRATLWSNEDDDGTLGPWLGVTTPNILLGAKDIDIELDAIAAEISQQLDWIRAGVRNAIDSFHQLGTIIEQVDRENYTEREVLSREIGVRLGDVEASFTEVIEVALGPGGAIATALSSLYAAMGGSTSQVNVRWQSIAAPSGFSARYAVTAEVNDGDIRSASFFLDVPANPLDPTRVVVAADQFIVTDGTTDHPAFVVEGGELKFVGARAGRITSADGTSFIIDFDNPEIYMES